MKVEVGTYVGGVRRTDRGVDGKLIHGFGMFLAVREAENLRLARI